MDRLFSIAHYLRYRLTAKTPHDVHSPFIFSFLNDIVLETTPYYIFEPIEALRAAALLDESYVNVNDWGAGSSVTRSNKRRIKTISQSATLPPRYAQLLFRMIARFKPQYLLELGTSLGFTSLYLASPSRQSNLITLEGSPEIAELARRHFQRLKTENIQCLTGEFSTTLPVALEQLKRIDFAFIDGNHRYQATMDYFHRIRKLCHENSVLVFDDIHWSRGMHRAWREISTHESVTFSVDLFRLGMVFFQKSAPAQSFTLRF